MQQHGGRNRYPAIDPSEPANKTELEQAAPRGTSLQVYPQPAVIPAEPPQARLRASSTRYGGECQNP
jgi:hypothetical protein